MKSNQWNKHASTMLLCNVLHQSSSFYLLQHLIISLTLKQVEYLLIILSARCLPSLIQTWQLQHCVKTRIIAVCLVSTSSLYHSELKSSSCSSWSLVGANVLLDKPQKNIKLTDFGLCTEMNVSTLFSVKWCRLSLIEHKNVCYRCVHYGITGQMCGHIDINNYCSNMVIML